jgi:hypothetical protein
MLKPKTWQSELTGEELRVDQMVWRVTDFRAFTIQENVTAKSAGTSQLIVLIPRRRFQPSRDIYLTGNHDQDGLIAAALETVLPYDPATGFAFLMRVIDRLARALRLN